MSLKTPESVRQLQRKLYVAAKQQPERRFHQLYDKIYRADILEHAYALARSKAGAPGVDGVTFEDMESAGLEEWLKGLGKQLHDKTYKPSPVRRVMIAKVGGGERPLGIPTVYRAIDNYVYHCAADFLRRRHKVRQRNIRQYSAEAIFGKFGVQRLRALHVGATA